MNNDHLMMRDQWMTMDPIGGLLMFLLIAFLVLGSAAFVKFLFFNKK